METTPHMELTVGMQVIHWQHGDGIVVNADTQDYPQVQFPGSSTHSGLRVIAKANLTDAAGRYLVPGPLSEREEKILASKKRAQDIELRRRERAQLKRDRLQANEDAKQLELETTTREVEVAVAYLTPLIPFIELQKPHAKTHDEAIELATFYQRVTGEDILALVYIIPEGTPTWAGYWKLHFPVVDENPPTFATGTAGSIGYRGPQQRLRPQARLKNGHYELCNTEVTRRLIEKGLRYKP